MAKDLLKIQGYMDVRSKALDDAFADTDVLPRQRLISAKIDYTSKVIDCATVEFADPDGRIAKAVRTGATTDAGQLVYSPWTVEIGYLRQSPEERTVLVGQPQLEVPSFPQEGDPTVKIKILDASVALKKNTTPGANPANYIEPLAQNPGPLRCSLNALLSFYDIEADFGLIDPLIDRIDAECIIPRLTEFKHIESSGMTLVSGVEAVKIGTIAVFGDNFCRNLESETDHDWLSRIARIITAMISYSGGLPPLLEGVQNVWEKHFDPWLPGEPSTGAIEIVVGIREGKLIFKTAYEIVLENGFTHGIPIIDWRCGNNVLLEFYPQTVEAETQGGWMALLANLFNRDDDTELIDQPPEITPALSPGDGAGELNQFLKDKKYYLASGLPDGSSATSLEWVKFIKEHLETNISGRAKALGIPKLLASQLIGFNGLGWGAKKEADAKEAKAQQFACYNRLYLTKKVTHSMDQTGLYLIDMEVGGCTLDGSEKDVIDDFLKRLKDGVNTGASGGFWDSLGLGGLD